MVQVSTYSKVQSSDGGGSGNRVWKVIFQNLENRFQRSKSQAVNFVAKETVIFRRNKVMNLFSVMIKNRFKNEEDEELEDPDKPKGKKGSSKKDRGTGEISCLRR